MVGLGIVGSLGAAVPVGCSLWLRPIRVRFLSPVDNIAFQ